MTMLIIDSFNTDFVTVMPWDAHGAVYLAERGIDVADNFPVFHTGFRDGCRSCFYMMNTFHK